MLLIFQLSPIGNSRALWDTKTSLTGPRVCGEDCRLSLPRSSHSSQPPVAERVAMGRTVDPSLPRLSHSSQPPAERWGGLSPPACRAPLTPHSCAPLTPHSRLLSGWRWGGLSPQSAAPLSLLTAARRAGGDGEDCRPQPAAPLSLLTAAR